MIIDFHTHIFSPEMREHRQSMVTRDQTLAALYSSSRATMATAEELIDAMDKSGIDVSVVVGIGWNDMELCRRANDYLIEAVQRFPLRLKGFCSVNPNWGSAAVGEVERCARAGLVGIGELHPDTQKFDLGDRNTMASLVEAAMGLGMPILTHASEPVGHNYPGKGRTTPEVLIRFINSFPHATIICAHWGGGLPFYALMPEVAQAMQHVFFDTAASPFLYQPEIFSVVANLVGDNSILFGTDYPIMGQLHLIREVEQATLTPLAKKRILYANATKILGM